MNTISFINSISLITAFFGGMVALFAPCCITFLLPSYLANIFREKGRVVWMTLIFGLGIATVLVPTALGIRAVGQIFQQYHTQTYVIGGLFMILLGLMELTGKKITLPMLNLTIDLNKRHDPWSVYLLGIFSGLTTSCCTPVLAGILTLSFLSPTFFWAAAAGIAYVFGMVIPLVVLSLLLEKVNWATLPQLRSKTIRIGGKHILISDVVAGVLYIATGIALAVLAISGRIAMDTTEPVSQGLGMFWGVARFIRSVPFGEYLFGAFIIIGIIWFIQKGRGHHEKE
ncbi:cytochrome c biogenesis protein CcdA [Candidatus Gottesmanbacteria bacterium]|nr:cytochrome c biogenesis protein CcdA [Candidatus Gottesmanbacteria bacterium]